MAVLLFHWVQFFPGFNTLLADFQVPGYPWLNPTLPLAMGWEGVTLFFVLSGYLLTSHLNHQVLTVRTVNIFYMRRVLRIYPAVWVQMMGLLFLSRLFPLVYESLSWQVILLNGILWINLPPVFAPMLNNVWWTLPVELLFYAGLPLLIVLNRKFGLIFCAVGILCVTLLWRGYVIQHYAGLNLAEHLTVLDSLPGVLTSFGAGFVAALLQKRVLRRHCFALLLVSVLAFLALQVLLATHMQTYWHGGALLMVWNSLLAAALAGIVLALCRTTDGITQRIFSSDIMVWLGNLSFGIYLWHYPVMVGLKALWPEFTLNALGSAFVLMVALPGTLTLAALSYRFVEKPMMRVGH